MPAWPRIHTATAALAPDGSTTVAGPEPAAVAGNGSDTGVDMGSPETLLTCALAWSYARALQQRAADRELEWRSLEIVVDATLDHNRLGPRVTRFDLRVDLVCAAHAPDPALDGLLDAALERCLVTATVAAPIALHGRVHRAGTPAPVAAPHG